MILAVLIHNRQPFDAAGCRSGLRNINHPRVKIPLFAGQTFINGIGNHMCHPAPVALGRCKRLPFHLALGRHVPQPKLDPKVFVVQFPNRTLNQRMGINRPPIYKGRLLIH